MSTELPPRLRQGVAGLGRAFTLMPSPVVRGRSALGNWDPARPTEGAYSALLWFEDGAFATLTYSGYVHFDSDEWCDWRGELGGATRVENYGQARRRLAGIASPADEAQLKLDLPALPRFEVIDEWVAALRGGQAPLHDGRWARATIEVCLGLLRSARERQDVEISRRDSP